MYDRLATGQTRYTYFLLAAAASAVALALNRTIDSPLSWSQMTLGLAVLCWGLSFFFGCRHLGYVNSSVYANLELIRVQRGDHPETGQHPQMIQAVSEGIHNALEFNSTRANALGHWQFRLLIAGALFYIEWHVQGMYAMAQIGG